MEIIKITKGRMEQILPENIRESDVISANAKKTLATIINYFYTLETCRTNSCLIIGTDTLREAVGIKKENMLYALQELIEQDLISRVVGSKWKKGERPVGSKYYVQWENLTKELRKKTADDLISGFLEASKTPVGNYSISNSISVSNSDSVSSSVSGSISSSGSNSSIDTKLKENKSSVNAVGVCSNTTIGTISDNSTIALEEREGKNKNKGSVGDVVHHNTTKTFSFEEIEKYCNVKVSELQKRYYDEEDLDRLYDELSEFLLKHQDVEGTHDLLEEISRKIGNMRGELLFGAFVSEERTEDYTMTKVF